MAHPVLLFVGMCIALFALDRLVLQELADTIFNNCVVLTMWMSTALLFCLWFWSMGHTNFEEEINFLLDWMLPPDNMFYFYTLFAFYQAPKEDVHEAVRALSISAVVLRFACFLVPSAGLLQFSSWIRLPLGIFVVWCAATFLRGGKDDVDTFSPTLALQRCLGDRFQSQYAKGCAWFERGASGNIQATMSFAVFALALLADVFFAVMSASSEVSSRMPNHRFMALCASVLSVYGLRVSYWLLHDLIALHEPVRYGLCLTLLYIALQAFAPGTFDLNGSARCVLYVAIFGACLVASVMKKRLRPSARLGLASEGQAPAVQEPQEDVPVDGY